MYPNVFGHNPDDPSLLTEAMDVARGGHFMEVPNSYPSNAWYHYDDDTCDYACHVTEYMYWGIVTNMNILNHPSVCNDIMDEWETCEKTDFQTTDELLYGILNNPFYKIPQNAPDGSYCCCMEDPPAPTTTPHDPPAPTTTPTTGKQWECEPLCYQYAGICFQVQDNPKSDVPGFEDFTKYINGQLTLTPFWLG